MFSFSKYKRCLVVSHSDGRKWKIPTRTYGRQDMDTHLEVTDGNRYFISIYPEDVSGATTVQDIIDAIDSALS